jgi:hypothetical protein
MKGQGLTAVEKIFNKNMVGVKEAPCYTPVPMFG